MGTHIKFDRTKLSAREAQFVEAIVRLTVKSALISIGKNPLDPSVAAEAHQICEEEMRQIFPDLDVQVRSS